MAEYKYRCKLQSTIRIRILEPRSWPPAIRVVDSRLLRFPLHLAVFSEPYKLALPAVYGCGQLPLQAQSFEQISFQEFFMNIFSQIAHHAGCCRRATHLAAWDALCVVDKCI